MLFLTHHITSVALFVSQLQCNWFVTLMGQLFSTLGNSFYNLPRRIELEGIERLKNAGLAAHKTAGKTRHDCKNRLAPPMGQAGFPVRFCIVHCALIARFVWR
jgi:hypothetical protein